MNNDKLLVVFGSAVYCDTPRDVDVVVEGEFGETERALVGAWMRSRGLRADLSLDVTTVKPWRGVQNDRKAELSLPCAIRDHLTRCVVLRGDVDVSFYESRALPAQIRAANSASELILLLGDPARAGDGRMATLGSLSRGEGADFDSYTQGRLALKNAIEKCGVWERAELLDPRLRFVRWFAEFGTVDAVRRDLLGGGQAGGGDSGVNWVRLDGIQLSYGRLIPWREALPMKRIRRTLARAKGRRNAVSVAI